MEDNVLRELEKYQLQLTTMWQESEVSISAKRFTRVKVPLSFSTTLSDLSERFIALEPAFQKQLLPMKVQHGQEYQHPSSYTHSYKPGNAKVS